MVEVHRETMTTFTLTPQGPFSFSQAVDVIRNFPPLRRHAKGIADDGVLRMAFPLDGDFGAVGLAIRASGEALEVEAFGDGLDLPHRARALEKQVARIFSLDVDGSDYPAVGRRDPEIGALMKSFPGLRPVCFTSPYEAAVWAILSQRVTTTQAANVLERFVEKHGTAIVVRGQTVHAFPRPERLLQVERIEGLPALKLERLRGIAEAALDGKLSAARLRALGDVDAPAFLQTLPGIGPFWASGIYLRACGVADVFPEEPLSIAALGKLHQLGDRPTPAQVSSITDGYRPFRMWICFLLRVAAARGSITGVSSRATYLRASFRRGRAAAKSA